MKPGRQLRIVSRKGQREGQQEGKQAACLKQRMYAGSFQKQWLLKGLCCTGLRVRSGGELLKCHSY